MRLVITTASLSFGLIVCLTACGNVEPGDRNYPALDPNAHENISVTGLIPEKWGLHIRVTYYPREGGIQNPITGGLVCGWSVGLGASRPYHVDFELPVVRSGNTFATTIPVDRYRPGHCGWHLSDLAFTVAKNGEAPTNGMLAQAASDLVRSNSPEGEGNRHTQRDLWCWDNPLEQRDWINGAKLNCELAESGDISPMKYIPAAKRGYTRSLPLKVGIPNLSFIFHDLDAEAVNYRAQQ